MLEQTPMKESRALTRARTFVGFLETWRYGVLRWWPCSRSGPFS